MRTCSPFPGMDPWLEGYWSSVHHRLIGRYCDQIQSQLPSDLFVDVEVSVYILDEEGRSDAQDRAAPDVAVVGSPSGRGSGTSTVRTSAVSGAAVPYRIKRSTEPVEEGHVVIRSFKHHEPLITAIEVLSPTNKLARRGRLAYIEKREAYYEAMANVVEIDLLRTGRHLIDVSLSDVPVELRTPYKACVRRARPIDDIEVEYYGLPLREPLSKISIPLRKSDPAVMLDLQSAMNEVYASGSYGKRIDYSVPVELPLPPEDAAWAAECIARPVPV